MNTNLPKAVGQITITCFALPELIAILSLIPAGRVTPQNFATLHSFTALISITNSDGALPHAGSILLSGNTLYGAAERGGGAANGMVSRSTPMARVLRSCLSTTCCCTDCPLPVHYSLTIRHNPLAFRPRCYTPLIVTSIAGRCAVTGKNTSNHGRCLWDLRAGLASPVVSLLPNCLWAFAGKKGQNILGFPR
jgi:hypothetical protein